MSQAEIHNVLSIEYHSQKEHDVKTGEPGRQQKYCTGIEFEHCSLRESKIHTIKEGILAYSSVAAYSCATARDSHTIPLVRST